MLYAEVNLQTFVMIYFCNTFCRSYRLHKSFILFISLKKEKSHLSIVKWLQMCKNDRVGTFKVCFETSSTH